MSWQDLAIQWADKLGVPRNIMLTTVEAETSGRNLLGDAMGPGGLQMAMGFGQVWASKWHYEKLLAAADDVGISRSFVPAQSNITGLQQFITTNDDLSMALAARTIKSYWEGAGGNFVNFLKGYVGPAVSQAEINRRTSILNKYEGLAFAQPIDSGTNNGSSGSWLDGLNLPATADKKMVAWTLIAVGVLVMLKVLGGDLAGAREKALEVVERA